MSITEDLKQEHRLISNYIALLEQYCTLSETHPHSRKLLEKAPDFMAFINEFADAFHHVKEEDILFEYLAAPGVLTHCNPLPVMLFEHGKARNYVLAMQQALANTDTQALAENAIAYTQLLREHIYKEDNILYPMAENGIAAADQSRLLAEYAKADARLNSRALWQKYQEIFAGLENYLQACSAG